MAISTSDTNDTGDTSPEKWTNEQWAQLVQNLGPDERSRRTQAVDILLDKPEEISDPLETELYLLRDQLQGPDSHPALGKVPLID